MVNRSIYSLTHIALLEWSISPQRAITPTTVHSLWISIHAAILRQAIIDVCWLRNSTITACQTRLHRSNKRPITFSHVDVSSETTLGHRLIDIEQLRYRDIRGLPCVWDQHRCVMSWNFMHGNSHSYITRSANTNDIIKQRNNLALAAPHAYLLSAATIAAHLWWGWCLNSRMNPSREGRSWFNL